MSDGYLAHLDREIARLDAERKRLDGEAAGLTRARDIYVRHAGGIVGPAAQHSAPRRHSRGRRSLRDIATDVLRDHPDGLPSSDAYAIAVEREGKDIVKSSFVSAMSVAASEGHFTFEDGIYKLPPAASFSREAASGEGEESADDDDDAPSSQIHPIKDWGHAAA